MDTRDTKELVKNKALPWLRALRALRVLRVCAWCERLLQAFEEHDVVSERGSRDGQAFPVARPGKGPERSAISEARELAWGAASGRL